jgi:hypothetical protein
MRCVKQKEEDSPEEDALERGSENEMLELQEVLRNTAAK